MKRITITLTEDQANQVNTLLWAEHERLYWLNVPDEKVRKRGRELAAFNKRILTTIKRELVKL